MALTVKTMRDVLRAIWLGDREDDEQTAKHAVDLATTFVVPYTKATADSMAADATAAQYFWEAPANCTVEKVTYIPRAAVTANATNYGTVLLYSADGAGGSTTTVASRATDTVTTDDMANGVPWDLVNSATAADLDVDKGEVLAFAITKAGSGVVIAAGVLQVQVSFRAGS